ncbi:MAG: hypothetical protein JW852_05365, partial [Spirochaetales bacterium]|nr:hypothetical protein [Spirochaetales bacterium]
DALSTTKSEGAWKETLGEKLSSIRQIRAEIREKNKTLDRLRELERGLKESGDEQRSVSSQLEQLRTVMEEHYEGIGAAAFELYRQSPALFRDITELFDDMEQLESGIAEKERELQRLESSAGPGSFIGKTLKRGKGIVLRGNLKTREMQRNRRLKRLGEQLCESADFQGMQSDTVLSRRIAPVSETIESLKFARKRMSELELESERLADERLEMERSAGIRNPLKNLEHAVRRLENELQEYLGVIGMDFYSTCKNDETVSARVSRTVAAIKRNEDETKHYKQLLERVEAGLEIKQLQKRKDNLDNELAAMKARIKELEESRAVLDRDIAEKEKLFGDLESLQIEEAKLTAAPAEPGEKES